MGRSTCGVGRSGGKGAFSLYAANELRKMACIMVQYEYEEADWSAGVWHTRPRLEGLAYTLLVSPLVCLD